MSEVVSVRVSDDIILMLSKIMKLSKKSKSEILVEAITLGLTEILKNIEKNLMLSDIVNDMLRKNARISIKGSESIVDIVKRERK